MYASTLVETVADLAELKDETIFTAYVLHRRGNGNIPNVTIQELVIRWKQDDEITEDMCDYLLGLYTYFKQKRITSGK